MKITNCLLRIARTFNPILILDLHIKYSSLQVLTMAHINLKNCEYQFKNFEFFASESVILFLVFFSFYVMIDDHPESYSLLTTL